MAGPGPMTTTPTVLITWRECGCDWATKFCDENHVKSAAISRDALDDLTAGATGPDPQDGGACGDLSPGINFGGDGDVERLMCELPVGHGGAHQHDNGDGLPPTRWIAAQDGGAEEAVRRVEALADALEDQAAEALDRYPSNPPMDEPIVRDIRAAANSNAYAADRIRAALRASKGEGTT